MTAEGKRRQISFDKVRGTIGRIDFVQMRRDTREPGTFEEGIGCHGFCGVGAEIIAHQFQKGVIAHPLARRESRNRTPLACSRRYWSSGVGALA